MTRDDYLNLITSQHRDRPNFLAAVTAALSGPLQVQASLSSIIDLFDLDKAVGDQLDIIGRWVGVSRTIRAPINDVYFTWDSADSTGWNFGVLKNPFDLGGIANLPDDVYRNFIRTKIAANSWDGTTEGAYSVWSDVFSNQNILIAEEGDMTISITLVGGGVDSLTAALLVGGYIPLKPEGVHIKYFGIPVDANKVFGFDLQSNFIDGWGTASFVKVITT